MLLVVALLLVGLVAAGVRVPGAALAQAVASRILCAASLADGCGDEPALIAAYGTEVGELVRRHMPIDRLRGGVAGGAGRLPALPQHRAAATGRTSGLVHRTDERLAGDRLRPRRRLPGGGGGATPKPAAPTARAPAPAISTSSTGPTTPTRPPCAASRSSATRATTRTTGRGSRSASAPTARSTSAPPPTTATTTPAASPTGAPTPGIDPLATSPKRSAPAPSNGWGPETHLLLVSGGSHAGNATGIPHIDRFTPGRRVHLIPLEPIAADSAATLRDQPALAQESLARPRGRRDRLSARACVSVHRTEMQSTALLRRHPQGAVEADRLAVQHRVGDDLADHAGVLLGAAEAGGEGDAGAEGGRAPPRAAPRAAACRRGPGRSSPPARRARPCRGPPAGSCRRCRPWRPRRRSGRSGRRRRRSRRC